MPGNGTASPTLTKPHPFENASWDLSHGVRVQTHQYDDTLYAFEVTQHDICLGTLIPNNVGDMERMKYVLDHDLSIDGFECNDEFGTVIRVSRGSRPND
jgi:hypothetical protein